MTTQTQALRDSVTDFLSQHVGTPTDADREAAAQRVGRGYAEGRISVQEFDERLAALWRTATYAELRVLVADMPAGPQPAPAQPEPAATPDRPGLRLLTAGLAVINAANFVVWALICIIGFRWESPWWLWSLVPTVLVLGAAWWATDPQRQLNRKARAYLRG